MALVGDVFSRHPRRIFDRASFGGQMRVLIVDDNFGYRRLLRRVLEAQRDVALVFEAADGEEALRLAQQFKPDVVLMGDTPGADGLETTRRIREGLAGAAVLVLSARDDEEFRERAAEYGAGAYLPKAASIFEILSAIRELQPTKAA
jgi:two-component system, NarL family, response regulator NreC